MDPPCEGVIPMPQTPSLRIANSGSVAIAKFEGLLEPFMKYELRVDRGAFVDATGNLGYRQTLESFFTTGAAVSNPTVTRLVYDDVVTVAPGRLGRLSKC
jgi:hypothetical protein